MLIANMLPALCENCISAAQELLSHHGNLDIDVTVTGLASSWPEAMQHASGLLILTQVLLLTGRQWSSGSAPSRTQR